MEGKEMKAMRRRFVNMALCLGALLFIGFAERTARADIVYLGEEVVQPAGQGVVPTVLTLQNKGTESGAVIRSGGRDVLLGDAKPGVNSKTISFTELQRAGVRNAFDLGIYLDIVEPGNDNLLTIEGRTSLVLTAYRSD